MDFDKEMADILAKQDAEKKRVADVESAHLAYQNKLINEGIPQALQDYKDLQASILATTGKYGEQIRPSKPKQFGSQAFELRIKEKHLLVLTIDKRDILLSTYRFPVHSKNRVVLSNHTSTPKLGEDAEGFAYFRIDWNGLIWEWNKIPKTPTFAQHTKNGLDGFIANFHTESITLKELEDIVLKLILQLMVS